MNAVGNGDFTTRINNQSKDEIGVLSKNFEMMNIGIKNLIHQTVTRVSSVQNSSESIAENVIGLTSASNEVTKAVEEIAHGSTEMASSVNERLVTGQKLGESIQQIVGKIHQADNESEKMIDENKKGRIRIEALQEGYTKFSKKSKPHSP